eukprot:scaffold12646_cov60-Phaeocystis_antarctica.AAC.6
MHAARCAPSVGCGCTLFVGASRLLVLAPLVERGHGLAVRTSRPQPRLRRRGVKEHREHAVVRACSTTTLGCCSLHRGGGGY